MKTVVTHKNFKKTAISTALVATIGQVSPAQAEILQFSFTGLWTYLAPSGSIFLQNTSKPYYYDATWGYGVRTQITGTMTFDTDTGVGSATIAPFNFASSGQAVHSNIQIQSVGGGLMLSNMIFSWNGSDTTTQVVFDGSGLFAEIPTMVAGDVTDAASCAISMVCATPASESVLVGKYPVGPVPIATSSFNVTGATGFGTTLGQLSLGTDDGVGGSPADNGPFPGFNINIDITTITLDGCIPGCENNKVGILRGKIGTAFTTQTDPTLYKGLADSVGNLVVQAKALNYPIDLNAVGSILDWVEVTNATLLSDGVSSIRTYQQLGGFTGFSLVTVTGGNTCTLAENCEESVGPDSFVTTRENVVNVAATALMADKPVRWQKFCTFVYNTGSQLVEPICGFGKTIEMD